MSGLSLDTVASSGAGLAAREGLDAVSLRSVAAELGVTPMALYRYVPDAAHLHTAVVELLLADLPRVGTSGRWDDRCRVWAGEARDVLTAAPGLARNVLLHWTKTAPALRAVDHLGAMLEADGPPGIDAVAATNTVLTYVLMRSQAEEAVRKHGTSRDLRVLRTQRSSLPFLWRHREEYSAAHLDEHFWYGLEVILAGLGSDTVRRRGRRASS